MLDINVTEQQQHRLIELKGEVDASNSVELDEAIKGLIDAGFKRILVDGSELAYISSAGLGVFMSYLEDFQEKQVSFVIFGLNDKVYNVFHILGLDQLMAIAPSREEALHLLYNA